MPGLVDEEGRAGEQGRTAHLAVAHEQAHRIAPALRRIDVGLRVQEEAAARPLRGAVGPQELEQAAALGGLDAGVHGPQGHALRVDTEQVREDGPTAQVHLDPRGGHASADGLPLDVFAVDVARSALRALSMVEDDGLRVEEVDDVTHAGHAALDGQREGRTQATAEHFTEHAGLGADIRPAFEAPKQSQQAADALGEHAGLRLVHAHFEGQPGLAGQGLALCLGPPEMREECALPALREGDEPLLVDAEVPSLQQRVDGEARRPRAGLLLTQRAEDERHTELPLEIAPVARLPAR